MIQLQRLLKKELKVFYAAAKTQIDEYPPCLVIFKCIIYINLLFEMDWFDKYVMRRESEEHGALERS